jgi:aubergine-like protein
MLIQVNAKLKGEPWAVKIPLGKIMILGFDVYHCPDRKGESVGALVATDNKNCTKYFSTVSFHRDKSELSTYLCTDVLKSLIAYKETNRALPTRILLFRDGVGEGQIEYVRTHEVEQVKLAIRRFYKENGCQDPVRLGFVIVTKKINTRFVVPDRARWTSPIPGTVLDNTVTLPERYEFFLVSQTVRQGTVSPTNYHVVHDDCGLSADQLQIMAYKLCHLYFNWSGTVAVPAPCQYAHKLAYITGMALADECPPNLQYNLWYL